MIADDFLDGYLNAGEEQAYGIDEVRQVVNLLPRLKRDILGEGHPTSLFCRWYGKGTTDCRRFHHGPDRENYESLQHEFGLQGNLISGTM